MKKIFQINEDIYIKTLTNQSGKGYITFQGVRRQRGAGFGSVVYNIAKYALPIFEKYVFPHAKEAVKNIYTEVKSGIPLKQSIKSHTNKAIKEAGKSLLKASFQQKGAGLTTRALKRKPKTALKSIPKKIKKCCKKKPKARKKKKEKFQGVQSIF